MKMLQIGTVVRVVATVRVVKTYLGRNKRRSLERVESPPSPHLAAISGMKRVFLGIVHRASATYDYDGTMAEDPPYLAVESSVLVYLVRFGMLNREVMVLPEDAMVLEGAKPHLGMMKSPGPWPDTEANRRYRADLCEIAKTLPRDAQGRFVNAKEARR